MMGRKQAATSAPPISTLDLDGYARNPDGPADSIHATDLTAAGCWRISRERARQIEERREVKLRRYLEAELGEAIRATVEQAAWRDRRR